ncbi:MAG TPA: urease accessory protein UreE [Hyphomicrobiaceae bacterium]|nr:urease accessory protein UreE [Hyphomicrobiaceae bacterium]
MPSVTRVAPRGSAAWGTAVDTITLDRQSRYRRRMAMTSDGGRRFLLDLAEATYLEAGDRLLLDDGSAIEVRSADEQLLEITASDRHALMRIAWHIGNRHTPCEITDAALFIQVDHVLAAMVEGLGGTARAVMRPFEPEGGAYGGKGALEHGHHHHDHGDGHSHHHHEHEHAEANGSSRRPSVWRPDGA